MIKVLTILGARPQFIKAASLSRYILSNDNGLEEVIVHTGQHYDDNMSEIFFSELKISKPKYNLGIGGINQGAMTGRMIEEIEKISIIEKPDIILVYGDTNSTLAGAIVSSKMHVPLAHIEAGLRSFNNYMPEEINRILTDRVSNLLFCPTKKSINNLKNEGFEHFKEKKIINCGDIMYESALYYSKYAKKPYNVNKDDKFILATFHRAETTNNLRNLKNVVEALNEINNDLKVIVPIHPRTYKILKKNKINYDFKLINPVSYLEMIWLIKNSKIILTDSGGLQKESYFFNKICLTLRDETEWEELIQSGNNILVGTTKELILDSFYNYKVFKPTKENLYGIGNTSQIIVSSIKEYFN